jgi:hypothetical protein
VSRQGCRPKGVDEKVQDVSPLPGWAVNEYSVQEVDLIGDDPVEDCVGEGGEVAARVFA